MSPGPSSRSARAPARRSEGGLKGSGPGPDRERRFPVRSTIVINRNVRRSTMFGLNRAEVIGRLGADVTVNHLVSGGRVANLRPRGIGARERGHLGPATIFPTFLLGGHASLHSYRCTNRFVDHHLDDFRVPAHFQECAGMAPDVGPSSPRKSRPLDFSPAMATLGLWPARPGFSGQSNCADGPHRIQFVTPFT